MKGRSRWPPAQMEWLATFSEMAAADQKSLMGRYRLMDVLLRKLNEVKAGHRRDPHGALAVGEIRGCGGGLAGQMGGGAEGGRRSRVSPPAGGFPAGAAMVAARCVGADARQESSSLSPRPEYQLARSSRHYQLVPEEAAGVSADGGHQARGAADFAQGGDGEPADHRAAPALAHTNVQEALALEVGLLKLHL